MDDEPWDFWNSVGLTCAGYSSANDADLINVFIESGTEGRWFQDIAQKLGLQESYVALLQEILCSADFCEYGTSPRGAWAIHDKYEENVKNLMVWYLEKWEQEFAALPTQ